MRFFFLVILLFPLSIGVYSTHLRAANIEIERVVGSSTLFELVLTIFSDSRTDEYGATNGIPLGPVQNVYVNNSDVPIRVRRQGTGVNVGNETNRTIYRGVYDAPSANASYTFKWLGENRNANIKNVPKTTVEFTLYVESNIYLSALDLPNNSPQMSIDPVDRAYLKSTFTYNSGAYDIDGDSLSYELIPIREGSGGEREASNTPLIGFDIEGQVLPNDPSIGGGGLLFINPVTGTVTWKNPVVAGQYNLAIKINEWRNGVLQGYVVRDMQIIVDDNELFPPKLFVPDDTCVVAGQRLDFDVIAWDSIGDPVALQQYGYPREIGAGMFVTPIKADSVKGAFSWSTDCSQPREQPYYAYFKAVSNPNTNFNLTSYETVAIDIVGGPVEGFRATLEGQDIRLNWDLYCNGLGAGYKIYRRSCDSSTINRVTCETGVPTSWGYSEIATIDAINTTTFLDEQVLLGVEYSYLIIAKVSLFKEVYSIASNAVNLSTDYDGPFIRFVSVVDHDTTAGNMKVGFSFVGSTSYELPIRVELQRAKEFNGSLFDAVDTLNLNFLTDSFFIDKGLNTVDSSYNYQIRVFDSSDVLVAVSQQVTSIELVAVADERNIDLSWDYEAPLFTPDSLQIGVFRDDDPFVRIDSTYGESYSYVDKALLPDDEYCYFIKKPISYCNNSLLAITGDTVVSNISCDSTFDNTPPCPPILALVPLFCDRYKGDKPFQNELFWFWDYQTCPLEEIEYYELYYQSVSSEDFVFLEKIAGEDSSYLHQLVNSFAGCYKIRGMDTNGNLGDFSNVVCNENCPKIDFPNIVTPNEDGKNDFFMPMPMYQFARLVRFTVYNRWGSKVRELIAEPPMIWDVKDADGNMVSDGVYYYKADVFFEMYDIENRKQSFNGWISVLK